MASKTSAGLGAAFLLLVGGLVVAEMNKDDKRHEQPAQLSRPAPSVGPGRHTVQMIVSYTTRPDHLIYTVAGVDTQIAGSQLPPAGWSHQVAYIPGAFYAVSAYQSVPGRLTCATSVDGALVDTGERQDAGSVRCYVNRPGR